MPLRASRFRRFTPPRTTRSGSRLIGCGGRGTGAAGDALSTRQGPIKLVAMADVFEDRLCSSYDTLVKEHDDKVDVSCEHKFIGFDAYKKAMDCLKPGDVVIMATPPAFRWVHFTYAIQKGLHTFMEKPVTVDGPTTRKMLALGEEAKKKNLKVGVGLMCRHCEARGELFNRIKDGEIGDIIMLRAYRQTGPVGSALDRPEARRHQRAALPDQTVPRVPLGQRRLLQRLPDPQHRRMLLDEGRLAGLGQGLRRPRAIGPTTSTRTSTPTRSNTPLPTAARCSSKGGTSTAATRNSPATLTAPRARPSSHPTRTARRGAESTRDRT